MGACVFKAVASGKTAAEAFRNAGEQARYDHGHGGYTGTIAEKHEFVTIAVPAGVKPTEYANTLLNADDPRIDDKWGPAGCVALGGDRYLFFGWASS